MAFRRKPAAKDVTNIEAPADSYRVEPHVRPSERVPGKFEAVRADGTVDPYAYRTEEDARKALEG